MKATITLKIKLETTEQVSRSLFETRKAYVTALNHTSDAAFEKKVFNLRRFSQCRRSIR